MSSSSFYVPESAMAIVAHPDDIEFSCAGTMARWAKAGARISYVLCTSGDVGIDEPGMTRARAAEIREVEARLAAEIAGVGEIIFLGEPDGLLTATLELRKKLVREIRRFRPEVVVTGDPTVVWAGADYINHPDHRAAALAAVEAVFPAAGQPNLFEEIEEQEGFKAHKVRKVYATTWGAADCVRQHRGDHRHQDRVAARPQEPDARLGPRRHDQAVGRRKRQRQRDALRRRLQGGHPRSTTRTGPSASKPRSKKFIREFTPMDANDQNYSLINSRNLRSFADHLLLPEHLRHHRPDQIPVGAEAPAPRHLSGKG